MINDGFANFGIPNLFLGIRSHLSSCKYRATFIVHLLYLPKPLPRAASALAGIGIKRPPIAIALSSFNSITN